MNKALITIIVAFASLSHLKSQTTISAQLRPRTEFRHGYKTLAEKDQGPAFFTSQRSRLNLKTQGEKFLPGISLQDVRTWGATEQLNASDDFFSLHEAWGEYFFTDHFSLKAGRQEVAYDNQRMFGAVNWAQQGRSHDLALLKYQNDSYKIHLGAAFNQENERLFETTYALNNYKTMQYIWFHQELTALSFSALFINNGLQTTDNVKYSHTLGGYAKGDVEGIHIEGSLYYQFGKDGNDRSLSALQFSMDAILTLNEEVNITGGIEHLSGTRALFITGHGLCFSFPRKYCVLTHNRKDEPISMVTMNTK